MENETMVVVDESGEEVLYEIVLTFENKEFDKNYVIYKLPGEENDEVFASSYNPDSTDGGELKPVMSDPEWDMIEEVLDAFTDEEE